MGDGGEEIARGKAAGTEPTVSELVRAWRVAAQSAGVVSELEAIFFRAAGAISARGPACWASGRCCNFEKAGHRLYVTGLEAAYTVARLVPGQLSAESLNAARLAGGCPFQAENLCAVHTIKPLACRVYFCDLSAQAWQQELLEELQGDLRRLHERHGVPYRYAEWRELLAMFVEAGEGPSLTVGAR